ncbi:hypothetical protein HK104_000386 [Borealophlyctis nickersoniae]|nr:hypothetical protein HK104_000386 [Borealophlyctis nickersoniae]
MPPNDGKTTEVDARRLTLYLDRLSTHLLDIYENNPDKRPGGANVSFSGAAKLSSLPAGYKLYETRRQEGTLAGKHADQYLFGHPSGSRFRSVNEFVPHLRWLVEDASHNYSNCACKYCGAYARRLGLHGASTVTPKKRPLQSAEKSKAPATSPDMSAKVTPQKKTKDTAQKKTVVETAAPSPKTPIVGTPSSSPMMPPKKKAKHEDNAVPEIPSGGAVHKAPSAYKPMVTFGRKGGAPAVEKSDGPMIVELEEISGSEEEVATGEAGGLTLAQVLAASKLNGEKPRRKSTGKAKEESPKDRNNAGLGGSHQTTPKTRGRSARGNSSRSRKDQIPNSTSMRHEAPHIMPAPIVKPSGPASPKPAEPCYYIGDVVWVRTLVTPADPRREFSCTDLDGNIVHLNVSDLDDELLCWPAVVRSVRPVSKVRFLDVVWHPPLLVEEVAGVITCKPAQEFRDYDNSLPEAQHAYAVELLKLNGAPITLREESIFPLCAHTAPPDRTRIASIPATDKVLNSYLGALTLAHSVVKPALAVVGKAPKLITVGPERPVMSWEEIQFGPERIRLGDAVRAVERGIMNQFGAFELACIQWTRGGKMTFSGYRLSPNPSVDRTHKWYFLSKEGPYVMERENYVLVEFQQDDLMGRFYAMDPYCNTVAGPPPGANVRDAPVTV